MPRTTELVLQEGRAGRIGYHFNELWRASLHNGAETLEVALQRRPIIFMDAKFDGSYDKVFFVEREVLGLGGKFFASGPTSRARRCAWRRSTGSRSTRAIPRPTSTRPVGIDARFKLSEHRGEIVVLTFWSRCAAKF